MPTANPTATFVTQGSRNPLKKDHGPTKFSNIAQKLAQEAHRDEPTKTLEEMVPKEYHEYLDVFGERRTGTLPAERPWDHEIETKPDFEPKGCKIYPLSPREQNSLDDWIKEQLEKGYIRPSKSPQASPFFFVGKKDGKLRPTQDYRYLNSGTKKNEYPIPRIPDLVDKLKEAKYFTKLDLRWGYNNVRIKDGHQWKAAFKTNRGLFEPMVMFFGLCNSPATFQAMMNELLKDLIDEGVVIVYLDDILIYTKTLQEHRDVLKRVLKILRDNDLYLKPEKCEFEQTECEYLGVIISENSVKMDPIKVKGITEWPTPTRVKDVQSFLGFCNFYRRFIEGFAKISKPLTSLTKKETPWNWGPEQQDAFEALKERFTTAPILVMADTTKPFRIECDASDFAVGSILSQKEDDEIWHPVAYISKSLTDTQRNYDIHDKELLAIIHSLETWRHYLEGCTHRIEIWTDHKNLEYFQKSQKLSRRQARWAQFLTRFDFILEHKPGTTNKADGLSRRIDHKEGMENDNTEQVVLPEKFFTETREPMTIRQLFRARFIGRRQEDNSIGRLHIRIRKITTTINEFEGDLNLKERIQECTELDDEVQKAIDVIKKTGPQALNKGLTEWNLEDGLVLYRGKVYVPKDQAIRREVVRSCHDPPIYGHPGRYKTLETVQRNYWWPGMSNFVKKFVEGCATCQETKINTHPTKEPLHPTEVPEHPFETVTTDLITDLPESDGYDSILMICDPVSKTMVAEPCNKTIDADGTAEALVRRVFAIHGISKKIISDRGPNFASKVMRAILKSMGVRSALSTAYHPQTDGQSERFNQEIETFLRAYCGRNQNSWAKMLPFAEIAHNNRIHSATKKTPFETLYGRPPTWPSTFHTTTNVPKAEERLKAINHAQEEAIAALKIAKEAMKAQHDKYGQEAPTLLEGDLVWLEGKNLKTNYPTAKIAPKRFGPFKITDVIGSGAYRLELPSKWRIHPVFHASLLTPYKETAEHGPNFARPPPDIIEGEEQYEVEEIVNHKRVGRGKQWQYFVKWKGYPDSDNTWEPLINLEKSYDAIRDYHKRRPKEERPRAITMALLKVSPEKRIRFAHALKQHLANIIERKKQEHDIMRRHPRKNHGLRQRDSLI